MKSDTTKSSLHPSEEVLGYDIDDDTIIGDDGFLAIRRLRLRNIRRDGSRSKQYLCDFITRKYGTDAVVVALYHRTPTGFQVLIRRGLRPAMRLGRSGEMLPIHDTKRYLLFAELVAGIIEPTDRGYEGLKQRAAQEVWEEAGYRVQAENVVVLGAGTFPSPGALVEKFWLTSVEIADPNAQQPLEGDGSPMEESATTEWIPLEQAITACVQGTFEDAKTELTLRRLRDYLLGEARLV